MTPVAMISRPSTIPRHPGIDLTTIWCSQKAMTPAAMTSRPSTIPRLRPDHNLVQSKSDDACGNDQQA